MIMSKEINLKGPSTGLSGEVKYILYDQDEDGNLTLVEERDWTDNTILINGLSIFTTAANPFWYSNVSVGASGSATNPASSTLNGTVLGSTGTDIFGSRSNGNEGNPDYEFWMVRAYRLPAGDGTGTIQEMGIGATPTSLFARHVVSPPIDKSPVQVLDVFYKLTCWPSLVAAAGTSLIGGVNYDTLTSFYDVDGTSPFTFVQYQLNTSASVNDVYDGDAAGLTDNTPQGDHGSSSTGGYNSTGGSAFRNVGYKLNLDDGITDTNIVRTATSVTTLASKFQTQFDATDGPAVGTGIPKTVADELTLNWQLTWGEKP
jgi:hypothetical protein